MHRDVGPFESRFPMATADILYVGADTCCRIPVLERSGLTVYRAEGLIPAILNVFAAREYFSAITFNTDVLELPRKMVSVTRSLSAAPLILFENLYVYPDKSDFDLIVPPLTTASRWLKQLHDLIKASGKQQERSRQLVRDCQTLQSFYPQTLAERRVAINSEVISGCN